MKTSIEWTDFSWNPIRARNRETGKVGHYCQRISPLCKNCYAASMNVWRGNGVDYTVPGLAQVELYLDEEALMQPLRWRTPRNIFVCSMTDLFADFVPDEWIERIYAVMALADKHTFMILTKRPARRLKWYQGIDEDGGEGMRDVMVEGQAQAIYANLHPDEKDTVSDWLAVSLPLKNVREGTSVGTQKEADEFVPVMLQTPAALRWLSMEPILEAVSLLSSGGGTRWLGGQRGCGEMHRGNGSPECPRELHHHHDDRCKPGVDWAVVGGESGTSARPTNIDHIRSVVRQCQGAGVPVFVKQLGKHPVQPREADGVFVPDYEFQMADAKGGDPSEWPEDLRVRQFPEVHQ